jgi:DNA polymerase III delta prime subunit
VGSNDASSVQTEVIPHPRFQKRWRLVGAGLSNVWRFGDLELPADSGRLLLRGPNGTGKTTALEALAPYLMDLNAARMSAGKARTTNLSALMREGAAGKRRCGYAWLTLAGPEEGAWSFGVRIQYSEGASPPVQVAPFAVPGRPLHELELYGTARASLTSEHFEQAVTACGGQIFDTEDAYVSHLAARLFGVPDREAVATLATRLRQGAHYVSRFPEWRRT